MEISLELLLETLQLVEWVEASCPRVSVSRESALVSQTALLPTGVAALDPGTLWCGYASALLTMDAGLRAGRSFLALGTEAEFDAISRRQDCNCLFFPVWLGLPSIFNEVMSVFLRFQAWDHAMELAIARKESVQKLVDLTDSLMENPLVLFNNSFEILAYSRNRPVESPQLNKVLQAGHFSGEELEILVRMNYLKESDQFSTLKLCYPPNWANCQFAMRIFLEGQKAVITMVQYFLRQPPTLAQLELLHLFELKMERYAGCVLKTGQRSKQYVYEPFLIDLLDGHLSRQDEILDRVRAINLPFKAQYRLYQLRFEKFTLALASYVRNNCKSIFPSSKIVVHHNRLFILDREDAAQKNGTREYRDQHLRQLLEICGACCGVSDSVPDLSQVHIAYLQTESALSARDMLRSDAAVSRFGDVFFWDMLSCFLDRRGIPARLLYFRALDVLMENDRATGNDNLRLLDVYLNCDRNITNTAKAMNLHRNSVIYRLERISEMLEVSLSDPEVRFQLLVSLKILSYLPIQPEAPSPEQAP